MAILETVLNNAQADRLFELDRRESGETIKGDFVGSVTGTWRGLGESASGLVSYSDKVYKTVRLGKTSIPAGTSVELSFANGTYYSNW